MYRLLLPLILLLTLALASGCTTESNADENTQPAAEAEADSSSDSSADEEEKEESIPVEVVTLESGAIEAVLKTSTHLEAERSVGIYSQTMGLVTDLLVEEGDRVREGQILLQIEDEEQKSAVRKAEAQLLKQERELKRLQKLFSDNLVSEQELGNQQHTVRQLEIDLDDARRNLRYTTVRAPISGTITERLINRGDRVASAAHLFNMIDFDSLVARVYLPEKDLGRLRLDQTARIQAKALGGQVHVGQVERISPIVDARSGTVKVTVAVNGRQGLRPGMFVDVKIVTDTHSEALLVPKRCLVYDRDRTYVFRIGDDQRAVRIDIESLLEDREHIEPASGLEVGDVLVAAGQASLKPGALVEILDPNAPTESNDSDAEGAAKIARALQ